MSGDLSSALAVKSERWRVRDDYGHVAGLAQGVRTGWRNGRTVQRPQADGARECLQGRRRQARPQSWQRLLARENRHLHTRVSRANLEYQTGCGAVHRDGRTTWLGDKVWVETQENNRRHYIQEGLGSTSRLPPSSSTRRGRCKIAVKCYIAIAPAPTPTVRKLGASS